MHPPIVPCSGISGIEQTKSRKIRTFHKARHSTLAARAPEGVAPAHLTSADRGATAAAGFALAIVDAEHVLKCTRVPLRITVIAQRGSAGFDGLVKHLLDRLDNHRSLAAEQPLAAAARPYARAVESLAGVNIAYSDHAALIHQQ